MLTLATASTETESPRSSLYLDPFTTLPEGYRTKSKWKSLVKILRGLGERPTKASIPPPSLTLTERNLTQFFNPDYIDVVEEPYILTKKHLMAKRESVSAWIERLP
jgi:hypothetical protein